MNRDILITGMGMLVCASSALAQSAAPARAVPVAPPVEMATAAVPLERTQVRLAAVESRVVSGRPYSAEATTEFVQVLGDGNKIARKTTVRIFRDGEGRTRREELTADGAVRSISLYDPVAHVSYVLDPETRTATKAAVRVVYPARAIADKVSFERGAAERVAGKVEVVVLPSEVPAAAAAEDMRKRQAEVLVRAGGAGAFGMVAPVGKDTRKEALGQKMIDGVQAEGTRMTTVIPAGAIGNQQDIVSVSEQWFSPDLEILVMTRHSDPRSGETTYSLSNIVRAEPPAGTFDVPADYIVKESGYMRQPDMR
jgi:hypothetical protein